MLKPLDFEAEWTEIGREAATGGQLNISHLKAIYDNLDLAHINPALLPDGQTVLSKKSERRNAIFTIAENLWGLSPKEWLDQENDWLKEARQISGSTEVEGKDKIEDVVSAELLIRILATVKVVSEESHSHTIVSEAINALNLVLGEACAKGRTRMIIRDGISVYARLHRSGVMFGGSGKYLPYPQKSLVELFKLLRKEMISPEAYLAS
ncbi:MAG TPA: hypothetical protein PLI45_03025 [Candidatus Woesebacteria bacterium]|nr:hypothetical protein [Candidatus Woesebacteria bacterium]